MNHVQQQKQIDYPRLSKAHSKYNQIRQKIMQNGAKLFQKKIKSLDDNPYLKGIYEPVAENHVTQFRVKGKIPEHLNGLLLRMGPNPISVENPSAHHWFVGDGMVHGLRLENGQAKWFKSRFVATDTVQKYRNQQTKTGFRRGPTDLVNTNVFKHAGKLWAAIEAGTFPVQLDFELNTESHQFFNSPSANLPFTGHPHQDPKTGDLHAICYDAFDLKNIYYEVVDRNGQLSHFCKIPVQHGPMIHDCAITERDVLIFDFPVTLSWKKVFQGDSLPYGWNPEHKARLGIIPKFGQAQDVQWIDVPVCFVFHTANAYRVSEHKIIVDVVVHDVMFNQSQLGPLEQQNVQLERWYINTLKGAIERKVLDPNAQEFPRLDERKVGYNYQYLYTVSYDIHSMDRPNHLICHDLLQQEQVTYSFGEEWMTGEVIFIPENNHSAEGQGYLLSYVHHVDAKASKVIILKIEGLELQFQAEIDLGVRVPIGFHCNWVDLTEI